jgi:hypothetical protein
MTEPDGINSPEIMERLLAMEQRLAQLEGAKGGAGSAASPANPATPATTSKPARPPLANTSENSFANDGYYHTIAKGQLQNDSVKRDGFYHTQTPKEMLAHAAESVKASNAKRVEAQVHAQAGQGRRDSDPLPKIFLAKQGSTAKQFTERIVEAGALAAYTDGRTCTSDSDPSALIDGSSLFLVMEFPDEASGTPTSRYVRVGASLFPVAVTKDGGLDSTSATTYADWTYTVKSLDGSVTLGTTIGLARPRPYGSMNFGTTYGIAFYVGTTLKLWDAGETENLEAGCT